MVKTLATQLVKLFIINNINLPDKYVVNQVSSTTILRIWMACLGNVPEYIVVMHVMLFPEMHELFLVLLSHSYLKQKFTSIRQKEHNL